MGEAGVLNERDILKRLFTTGEEGLIVTPIISPKEQFQPASLDLRLGTEFLIIRNAKFEFIDLLEAEEAARIKLNDYVEFIKIRPEDKFVLHPNEFVLGCTFEYFRLPSDLAGRLEGKSTWGRMGLQIHSTAGFVDPGFSGSLTFELQNIGKAPIPLYPGLIVAQICFFNLSKSMIPYRSKAFTHYGGWAGLQPSRYFSQENVRQLRLIHERLKKMSTED